jgi:ssDNA-binding Zn-finger/Zn-ribbon topoisomerase 1
MGPRCGDCGYAMRLCPGKEGRQFWGCVRWPDCSGRVAAHPDGSPMGRPADKATREARKKAHDALDSLWQSGEMTRTEAYVLACKIMNRSRKSMHISLLDKDQCEELARKIVNFKGKRK